jgi:hypothetical protein
VRPLQGLTGTWALYTGSTASIRVPASSGTGTVLECYSMQVTGEGASRVLTVAWLGGEGFTVANQCSPTAISLSPNGFDSPYCASLPGSNSPYQSTILGTYTVGASSGAAAVGLLAAAAAAAAAALVAAAL